MNLRTRFALGTAALVVLAIAVTGWLLVEDAEDELVSEVDSFLLDRAELIRDFESVIRSEPRGSFRRGPFGAGRFSEDDAIAQVVLADGSVFALTDVEMPVDLADVSQALRTGEPVLGDVDVDGVAHRVLTTDLRGVDAAVMIGRDISEVNAALDGLTRRALITGALGAVVAAVAGWVVGGRLSRPVRDLTLAAEHVAITQDLASPIGGRPGNDEVGRLSRSFDTMLTALDTSRRQQQRLVMDASHELRTPLTSIRTNIDLLRRARSLDEDERSQVLDDVGRELDELGTLVAELVELSTSSRRPDEPIGPVDLAAVAEAVVDRANRRFGRDVRLASTDAATIRGRRSLLDRAMWNLVANAAKFSPEGTAIEVRVVGATVLVRDHGAGITPDDRDHVFDRFYRSPDARSAPGSGLGLSIVADIVEAHGGSCFVREPDDGEGGAIVGFDVVGLAETDR
ncbi:MAG: HAMP domain-containing sensor histidine kinase [Actinomycetota bacterium]